MNNFTFNYKNYNIINLTEVQSSPKRHPVILIPGDAGSRIQAKLNGDQVPPDGIWTWPCKGKRDWFDLWVNIEQLTIKYKCWEHNMALVYNTSTR